MSTWMILRTGLSLMARLRAAVLAREVERSKPVRIGGVAREVPVEVGRAVAPPDGAALAEAPLRPIDVAAGHALGLGIPRALRLAHRAARRHELPDEPRPRRLVEVRVRAAPQTAAHDDVTAVRRG